MNTKETIGLVNLIPVVEESALKNFDLAESWIEDQKKLFSNLSIAGVDDREGYENVHKAYMVLKNKVTDIETRRKELKELYSLAPGRVIDAEATRLKELIEPLRDKLKKKRDDIDEEKDRIKKEDEKKRQQRIQERTSRLLSLGMSFTGEDYWLEIYSISIVSVATYTDEEFNQFYDLVSVRSNELEELKKAEELKKKTEQEDLERKNREQQEELDHLRLQLQEQQSKTPPAPEPVKENLPEEEEISDKEYLVGTISILNEIEAPPIKDKALKSKVNPKIKEIKKITTELKAILNKLK